MATTNAEPIAAEQPKRFHLDWLLQLFIRPRKTFEKIAAVSSGVWLTPLLVLTVASLLYVFAAGNIRQANAQMGVVQLPPGYEYWSPDQQNQYQQTQALTSGPVFMYVFPGLSALGGIWIGWLIVGGLMHLVLTLLGGRGNTGVAMNLVAWAGLPFALRDLVRAVAVFSTRTLINKPGLSGFVGADPTDLNLFLTYFLALVDVYMIWHLALLVIGVRASFSLSPAKAIGGAVLTLGLVLGFQALIGFALAKMGGLTVIRPFF